MFAIGVLANMLVVSIDFIERDDAILQPKCTDYRGKTCRLKGDTVNCVDGDRTNYRYSFYDPEEG